MNIQHWKIFDKSGSLLNWTPDSLINLTFNSLGGKGANGYLITDASGIVTSTKMIRGGYGYDNNTIVTYNYSMSANPVELSAIDASIILKDVSIFGSNYGNGINSKSIIDVSVNLNTTFIYPSATYAAAIFLKPISIGLVETEHLFIIEEDLLGNIIRPYDPLNSTLLFKFIGNEDEIQFFNVNENTSEITWSNELIFDLSVYAPDIPLQINIGFKAEDEGVFERILRIYHVVNGVQYIMADIIVNAQSIGEDERFRSLLTNFGVPDPIDIKHLFKESDINEDLPDWELINSKSKHMILEHDKIIPYVGTYKGLINAIKWLGYDDIFFREWFLDVKSDKKLSFIVPYDAKDRTQTILMFNSDERKTLKKLNQLSLNYCLTRETGTTDIWGTPETENCYSYNLKEVFVKLLSLKQWLERNIIGINARIIDVTGEGIYIERIKNAMSVTDNIGYNYYVKEHITPYGINETSELVNGDASIALSIKELQLMKIGDLPYRTIDFIDYAWNPNDPSTFYYIEDPSYIANPSDFLLVGPPMKYPFLHIRDFMYSLSVEKEFAGVIGSQFVSNPLFVLDNDLRFYNIFDVSSVFYDTSTSLTMYLEKAYLRDPSIDEWINSIAYSIYPNASMNGYIMESSSGQMWEFFDYPTFNPDSSSLLMYAIDSNYKVPLLSFKNYKITDASGINTIFNKTYYLDILDGKIEMNGGIVNPISSSDNYRLYLNFNYDTSLIEQMITINAVYNSPRMQIYQIDPSIYYWSDPSGKTGGNNPYSLSIDNSTYTIHVNHIGNYNIEIFTWDGYNTLFYNTAREKYPVWIKFPTVQSLTKEECYNICANLPMSSEDVSILITQNLYPIYDRNIPLEGLRVNYDINNVPYIVVPSITYFQDIPRKDSINVLYNLTEKVIDIPDIDLIMVDNDYQNFYVNDDIKLVQFDKSNYEMLFENSYNIINISGSNPMTIELDASINSIYEITNNKDIFILNNTLRQCYNIHNENNRLVMDISTYTFSVGQRVGVIVSDVCTGFSWGSTYIVMDVSIMPSITTHIFSHPIPEFFMDSSRYSITAKHAFSTFTKVIAKTENATETNNEFNIYFKDSYCQENYVDNTFIYINILFDQDKVNEQWYDPSDNLINSTFYHQTEPILVDVSTLVILRALYDSSNYMLNQKNIWQIIDNDSSTILFKVFNDSVPYIFNEPGTYNIECISYDSFGNAIRNFYEGLIKVANNAI